jgi:tRNA (guanine37-N1)-methyltransferase
VSTVRKRAVVEALSGHISEAELKTALKGIDIIGDIAVVKLPRSLEMRGHEMGELLLSQLGAGAVYRQTTPVAAGTKVRGLEWLAGRRGTEATHRESGCAFHLDISKVYFSPRLSHERMRIARLVGPGEVVVNMFAGVGTFSVVIAKNSGAAQIYCIDKSSDAFRYMVENIEINGLEGRVVALEGDAREAVLSLWGVADRVLMPLPELALRYIPDAVSCLRGRGVVHVYLHQEASSRSAALDLAEGSAAEGVASAGARAVSSKGRIVRSVGRNLFQVAVDIEVVRKDGS